MKDAALGQRWQRPTGKQEIEMDSNIVSEEYRIANMNTAVFARTLRKALDNQQEVFGFEYLQMGEVHANSTGDTTHVLLHVEDSESVCSISLIETRVDELLVIVMGEQSDDAYLVPIKNWIQEMVEAGNLSTIQRAELAVVRAWPEAKRRGYKQEEYCQAESITSDTLRKYNKKYKALGYTTGW
jgi:hypothetical protein